MLRRFTVLGIAGLLVLTQAVPAYGHGGGGTDATNFLSTITGVEMAGPDGKPAGKASINGVEWKVIAGDAMLQVENRNGSELRIPGYTGEPYLRIGPDGVQINRNSPATYLNEGRFGGQVPSGVSGEAEPRWEKVADEPVYAWHEHRIHWMSATPPPQVQANEDVERHIFDWAVPFELNQQSLVLTGQLRWIPPLEVWPWLVGGLTATSAPLAGLIAARGSRRRLFLLQAGAGMVFAFALLSVVHTVDDLIAVPATALENVFAAGRVVPFVILAILGAIWAWRGSDRAHIGLAVGAGAISLGIGIAHVFALSNSQIATTLPEEFSRAIFAGTMMLFIPWGIAAWLARTGAVTQPGESGAG